MPAQHSSSHVQLDRLMIPVQAVDNALEKSATIVYGVPQSKAEFLPDRFRHDMASLDSYFKCILAKDESITL